MSETTDESKRNRRTAKRILAIGLPLVLIAGAGVGYAYWTSNGTGAGTASTAATPTAQLTVAIPALAPGSSYTGATALTVYAKNTSSTTLKISSITVGTLGIGGSPQGGVPACQAVTALPTASATVTAPGTVAPDGQAHAIGTLTVTWADDPVNDQSACKGATFSFPLS